MITFIMKFDPYPHPHKRAARLQLSYPNCKKEERVKDQKEKRLLPVTGKPDLRNPNQTSTY